MTGTTMELRPALSVDDTSINPNGKTGAGNGSSGALPQEGPRARLLPAIWRRRHLAPPVAAACDGALAHNEPATQALIPSTCVVPAGTLLTTIGALPMGRQSCGPAAWGVCVLPACRARVWHQLPPATRTRSVHSRPANEPCTLSPPPSLPCIDLSRHHLLRNCWCWCSG